MFKTYILLLMIIAICGKKRAGKDTTADYLIEKYNFTKYSIADPVKEICRSLFDFTDEQLYGSEKEIIDINIGLSPRDAMQKMGTEFGQYDIHKYWPNLNCAPRKFWVFKMKNFCLKNKDKNIIIPDVRFKHEIDLLKTLGAKIWKIERDVGLNDDHISEIELDDFNEYDKIFQNSKNIDDLRCEVYNYMQEII
jgi:hypothetical protein